MEIIVALITVLGGIATATITAFANIYIAQIQSPKSRSKSPKIKWSSVIFLAVIIGTVGCAISYLVANTLVYGTSNPHQQVDLGSPYKVSDTRDSQVGKIIVYSHYPVGVIRYRYIGPDDTLTKAFLVCGFYRSNIFNRLKPYDISSELTDYDSDPITVSDGCHIEFTVMDALGDKIGIQIDSERVDP